MAKKMFLSASEVDRILADVRKRLLKTKRLESVIDLPECQPDKRQVKVLFTAKAWCKIKALVEEFTTEIQWHGLVKKTSPNTFKVYDIIVPPHKVSATTVVSDSDEYNAWLDGLDDEVFDTMRMHGHSHVNMSCTPSSVDNEYRRALVSQLPEMPDSFYLFFIFNKRGEWTGEVFDVGANAIYSSDEIEIDVVFGDGESLTDFVECAQKVAIVEKTTPVYSWKNFDKPFDTIEEYNRASFGGYS